MNQVRTAAQDLQDVCHGLARQSGWWTDLNTGEPMHGWPPKRNVGELLCLVHSEISEAMEGHRKGLPDDKLPHRSMLEVELADAVIRIFDMAGADAAEALVLLPMIADAARLVQQCSGLIHARADRG